METDLLTRICGELEQRMAQLRPLCEEYERLTEAAATLEAVERHAGHTEATSPSAKPPTAPRRGRGLRGSAAGAIARAAAASDNRQAVEPKARPGRTATSEVAQAILAALEHGSHTVSELVMVTAKSAGEIRAGLSRLRRQRKITKVKRPGDGKSAYALPAGHA